MEIQSARWCTEAFELIDASTAALPVITAADVRPIAVDLDFWDMWQLSREDGSLVIANGRSWWFFLAAAKALDPEGRHDHARIHLVSRGPSDWRDHGSVMPIGLSPGSREWSGSCVLGADGRTVNLYFTAAGRREGGPRFEQRLFVAQGTVDFSPSDSPVFSWSQPVELFRPDGKLYAVADQPAAPGGMIRGFRDPTYFIDPATGSEYVLFTGTSGRSMTGYDGVIGAARRTSSHWTLLHPIIDASGINNELERAHIVVRDGLYYLFWSTHASRFAPGIDGRTGLYGMVSEHMEGPWLPLNGSSLVGCNPVEEPTQAYCWWVTAELDVISFVNYWGLAGRSVQNDPALARERFGGTVAPLFRLRLEGDRAAII